MSFTFKKKLTNSGGLSSITVPTWVSEQTGVQIGDDIEVEVERLDSGQTRMIVLVTPKLEEKAEPVNG